jgi:hypothetical protein
MAEDQKEPDERKENFGCVPLIIIAIVIAAGWAWKHFQQ